MPQISYQDVLLLCSFHAAVGCLKEELRYKEENYTCLLPESLLQMMRSGATECLV